MTSKLILLIIFNLIYTLNNYSSVLNIVIINIFLFLFEFLIIKGQKKYSKKSIIISIIISILFTLIYKNTLIYGYKNIEITIKNLNEHEVEINSIYINNEKQKLNNLKIQENNPYDVYNKLTDNYKIILFNTYSFNTEKNKNIKVNFERINKDYKVLINDQVLEIPSSTIDHSSDYYKIYDNYYAYDIDNVNYENNFKILNFTISIIALTIIIISILNNSKKDCLISIFLALSLSIFEFNDIVLIGFIYKIFLFLLILLIYLLLKKLDFELILNDKKNIILNFISSFVITFSFIGALYLDNPVKLINIIIFLSFMIWIIYIIDILKKLILKMKSCLISNNKSTVIDQILLFILPLIILLVYLYIFEPFIITTDGIMQLREVKSTNLSNWHPFFHTYLLALIYKNFGNFQIFIILRIIILSLLISRIATYFINKGIKRLFVYTLVILLCLNPIIGIYSVSLLKDVDYLIFLILLTFIIIKYVNGDFNNNLFSYIINNIALFISILLIALFRHNGLYVSIVCSIVLLILFIKNKTILPIIAIFLSLISLYIINTFLYKELSVSDGLRNSDIITIAHGLESIIYKEKNTEIENIFSKYINLQNLNDSYNKYNIDILLHYVKEPFRNVEVNKLDLVKIYLKNILKHPDILITDRLYGTDIMWNVFKSDDIQTYDYQIIYNEFDFEYYTELKYEIKNSKIKTMIINISTFISSNKILNAIFLRTGLYIVFIIMLTISFYKIKNLIILIPIIINIITLLLAMHHQSYRYVMFIPIITLIYFLQIVSDKK